ncbi:MAG: hypothetical protein QOG94_105, partial [Solirubrobacteraceae bacterium]|nr:hypothetical protein [Solirubrobacteraceae bacterium]
MRSVPALGLGAAALHATIPHAHGTAAAAAAAGHDMHDMAGMPMQAPHAAGHGGHAGFRGGEVDHRANGFDPHAIVRDFDWGTTSRL